MTVIHDSWQKLQEGVPAAVREGLANKTASRYMSGQIDSDDYAFVCDLFRALARDAEEKVRQTLSYELRYANDLPKDIAERLAADTATVARPMLHRSPMLDDAFLTNLINQGIAEELLEAISQRQTISETLGLSLIERGTEHIALQLSGNKGADITETLLIRTAEQFPQAGAVLSVMMERSVITSELAQTIINQVSSTVGESLIQRYPSLTLKLNHHVKSAKDWNVLEVAPTPQDDAALAQFVHNLNAKKELTHSFLIKALCTGKIALFEHGISTMSELELSNARRLLAPHSGALAFRAVCTAAQFPVSMHKALQAVYHIAQEESATAEITESDYSKRMMQRIMADRLDSEIDNMDVILAVISRNMHQRHANMH